MSTTGFMEHINDRHEVMNWVAREKTDDAKQAFYKTLVSEKSNDKAFDEAVKSFQEKTNPSEDMLVLAKQIGDISKNTMNPHKLDSNEWLQVFSQHTAPMLQLVNSWVDNMRGIQQIR